MKAGSPSVVPIAAFTILAILASTLVPPASLAAAPQTPGRDAVGIQQPPLQHDVTVSLKLIQVFVTDKKGRPIADLRSDEFKVFDNGREVKISEFERHDLVSAPPAAKAKPAEAPVAAADPALKAKPTPDSPGPADSAPAVTRKFLLFFDFAFNTGKGFEKAMTAAYHFLYTQVTPDDEVGVMSFSLGKGMKIHEFFTVDHGQVRRALREMTVKDVAGRFENMEHHYWAAEMAHSMVAPGESEPGAQPTKDTILGGELGLAHQELNSQVQLYLGRLTDLARALRYIPGQKNLIVFSTGIPNSIFHGVGGLGGASRLGDFHLRTKNEETIKELASANVTLFTFDTREQSKPADLFHPEQRFSDGAASNILNFYTDEKITGRYTLEEYSRKTGGKYFGNIREYERSMEQVHSLTGTFYVLGYPVREEWDGRYHELKIETTRPGAKVHTQAGYYNPKPFASYSTLEKEMHLFDLALSDKPISQAPKPAAVAAMAGPGGGLSVLTRLEPETVEALRAGPSEVVAFLFDDEGQVASLGRIEHHLSPYKDRSLLFAIPVRLNPGGYSCRVVVRDMETGIAAVGSARAIVPREQTEAVRLHVPMVLMRCDAGAPVLIEKRASEDAPSCLAAYPWDAGRYAPALGPIPQGTESIRVVLPCTIMDETPAWVRGILVDGATSERAEMPLVPVGHAQTGHTVMETYEIPTADLRAGDYTLYFHAVSEEKPLSHAWVRLTIR